jgi:RNA-directed DNA polymerase
VLANLLMHDAFDMWMVREYPGIRFERYADDVVVHCVTERQARTLVAAAIGDRMEQVGLRLRPDKTKVVYCQGGNRRHNYGLTAFTFLGFTFRARAARTQNGTMFVSFQPAISKDAQKQDQRSDPPMAAAPLDRAHPGRDRPTDQSCRAGLDAVLRSVLPLRAVSTPGAHQRLRDALDPQQIQTAAHHQESQGLLAAHHQPASPALRPLGMGAQLLAAIMTRAR